MVINNCRVIPNTFIKYPGNMLSAGNKTVSKTIAVLALKKLSIQREHRYNPAMVIKSDA